MKKMFSIFLMMAFISSCYYKPNPQLGTIYGKISITSHRKDDKRSTKELIKLVKLKLDGCDIKPKIESSGVFYFVNIPPGKYDLQATLPDYQTNICENLEVSADSISLLYNIYFKQINRSKKLRIEPWHPKKIKTVDIQKRGSMAGCLYDFDSREPIDYSTGIFFNTFNYGTGTNYDGCFEVNDLLPAKYSINVGLPGYYETYIDEICVVEDSIAVVDIPMSKNFGYLPDDPHYLWEKKYKEKE